MQPGPPVPAQPLAPQKSGPNWILLLALVGGGLFLLVAVGVAGMWFFVRSSPEPAPPVAGSPTPAVPVATGASVASPSDTCAKAEACCKQIVNNSGANPESLKACENLRNIPDCAAPLAGYRKSAGLIGLTCD